MKKAYVSATYRDLVQERAAVRQALEGMRVHGVAMEAYVADTRPPLEKCLRDVRECDLYIGVFAFRYGYVPDGETRAITELEYRAAVEAGIPCLIFLLHEDAPRPRSMIDRDSTKIDALREELARAHGVSFFSTPEELARQVATAVHHTLGPREPVLPSGPYLDPEIVKTYYKQLAKQYSRLDLETLTPPQYADEMRFALGSVFVEQDVREDLPPLELPKELRQWIRAEGNIDEKDIPEDIDIDEVRRLAHAYRERPCREVFEFLTSAESRNVVLLGDPGAGKSTLARYLTLALTGRADDVPALEGHLPLLIELKSYMGAGYETFLDFVDYLHRTETRGLPRGPLHSYLSQGGQALVIFDGLDEIFDPEQRATVTRRIAAFAAHYPATRVLVTSRIIGYGKTVLTDAGFAHATLQDLSTDQIREFLTSWYALALHDRPADAGPRTERILTAVENARSIREMAGNPLLLTILAIIGRHQELPRERWKVYDFAATVLVQRWDVERYLRDKRLESEYVGEEEKRELLRRIALRMQEGGRGGTGGNYLTADELREEFESYLRGSRFGYTPAKATAIANVMIQQFRERNFILSRYGTELYGFVHRAFLEYFCADAYRWQLERHGTMTMDDLKTNLFGTHWNDPAWREVLRLIAGMVTDARTADIVIYLADEVNWPWPWAFTTTGPPWNIALAVQCLAEKRLSGALETAAERVLIRVIQLIEHQVEDGDVRTSALLDEEIVPAVESVGVPWPHSECFLDWYVRRGAALRHKRALECGSRIVAAVCPEDDRLLDILLGAVRTTSDIYPGLIGDVLRRCVKRPQVYARCVHWSADRDPVVRRVAVGALAGRVGDPAALQILLKCAVDEGDAISRLWAVSALAGRMDDPAVLRLLLKRAVEDGQAHVRFVAVGVLTGHSDSAVHAMLRRRAVEDPDESVRSAAVRALAGVGDPRLLTRFLQDPEEVVRQTAVAALGEGDDPAVLSMMLERAVRDRHASVRQAAVWALGGRIADAAVLSVVMERAVKDPVEVVRLVAVQALGEAADAAVLPVLSGRAVDDSDPSVRAVASTMLERRITDTAVLSLLLGRAVEDPHRDVRLAAVAALRGRVADAAVLPVVLGRAVEDSDEYVRRTAWGVLARHFGSSHALSMAEERAGGSFADSSPWVSRMALCVPEFEVDDLPDIALPSGQEPE
ncbi:HEAT repeat domain-containing protein [Sphaerisporangium sp. TRM90804]|uniref:HEAT repeat domain-containing protein n=1 Tax=Sphaerisporangium sp. TRM90804 TaxID=3031113 RepID=UPI002448A4C3|nr:HEAT repeat domain-containing protein [Sphaerisporangium sp. TRM90804]MDH2427620.1 HEAT repeat domain-containing protein [Sphaerisporangium sp. TRM90804]